MINDEALHASDLGGVDQSHLMHHTGRAHDTNDGGLARQGFGQFVQRVVGFDSEDSRWEGCRRMGPADHAQVKTSAHAKVARGRSGC